MTSANPQHFKGSANHRGVTEGLYARAVELLGHPGVWYVVTLMGYYTAVSLTMNFYAVPAGTAGISR